MDLGNSILNNLTLKPLFHHKLRSSEIKNEMLSQCAFNIHISTSQSLI